MIQGVDLSKWNGAVDWQKITDRGARFAIIKATEASGYKDPAFPANYEGAKAAGLVVGAYHFFRATIAGENQAQNIETTLNAYPLDLPVQLDVELFDNIEPALVTSRLQRLVAELQGYQGYAYPGIYTSVGLWNPHVLPWSGWKNCPLWVAHWNVARPMLPRDWTEYLIWQYRLDEGSAWGVQSVKIDLDQWNESNPFPGSTPEPEEPEAISLTITADCNEKHYIGTAELAEIQYV